MLAAPNCYERNCKWFIGAKQDEDGEVSERVVCQAYPDKIPDRIAYGDDPHDEVQDDQVGSYVFERDA